MYRILSAATVAALSLSPANAEDLTVTDLPSGEAGIFTSDVVSRALPPVAPDFMPETGKDLSSLLKNCTSSECLAYTSGAISGISAFANLIEVASPFCATGKVDAVELSRIVDQALETRPQLSDYPAPYLLLTAFTQSYPCQEEVSEADPAALSSVDDAVLAEMIEAQGTMVVYGNPEAAESRTIRVFHDPNCSHCAAFRGTLAKLAADGDWKVEIYPVAVVSEDSAGFAAVAIALKESHPDLVEELYRDVQPGQADMAEAMRRAEAAGISQAELFALVTKASGYGAVEKNTEFFVRMGAKGTPSFIVGQTLHNGALSATAIKGLVESFEDGEEIQPTDIQISGSD